MKRIAIAGALALGAFGLAGCATDAQKTSDNISKAADSFEVQRRIVGINGITDKPAFEVEGRCSIDPQDRKLVVTCKQGPNDYRKHYIGLGDNTFWVSTQLEGIDANQYRTRIILKPENIVPDFDLQTGGS